MRLTRCPGMPLQMTIPKKRAMNAQHDKAVQRFHRTIYEVREGRRST